MDGSKNATVAAWRGVLKESVQSAGPSGFGGSSGISTIANAWSVLSLILKKRSLYRFLSHISIAAGSECPMISIAIRLLCKVFRIAHRSSYAFARIQLMVSTLRT